jgi:nucleoid DNA-binding protein
MLASLYKYLVLNDTVSIPGVGNFKILRHSASLQHSAIHPPSSEIIFEPGTALADKNFYHFIALENNSTDVDAVRKLQDFAYQLKKEINSNAFVELKGLGVLSKNSIGEIIFKPASSAQNYLPVLNLQDVLHRSEDTFVTSSEEESAIETEEEVIKKDRWWIWATVLAVLAIAAIAYFYWQEGM